MKNDGTPIRVKERNQLAQFGSDCWRCSGLCCVALYCFQSDGFPQNKPAGKPCIYLQEDFRCRIHGELKTKGMRGCIGYDCFGAGPYVTERLYGGETWRTKPEKTEEICDLFVTAYRLFEIRFFLCDANTLVSSRPLWPQIDRLLKENQEIGKLSAAALRRYPMDEYQDRVNAVLKQACTLLAQSLGNTRRLGKDLINKNFQGKDLSGADFNMRPLIASNLKDCQLSGATFIGTDTRGVNFDGADLREAVFLSQGQVNAAKGSRRTLLPEHLQYPSTWR